MGSVCGGLPMPAERLSENEAVRARPQVSKKTGKSIPRMLNDGKGLLLRVSATGGKSWIYRYKVAGKAHDVGLGAFDPADKSTGLGRHGDGLTLGQARDRARELRMARRDGNDPLAMRRQQIAVAAPPPALAVPTFKQAAERWIDYQEAGWSPQHRRDVASKFAVHIFPT